MMELNQHQQEIFDQVVVDMCPDEQLHNIAAQMFMDRKRGKLHKLWSSEKFLSKLSSRLRKSQDVVTVERAFYETLYKLWLKELASRPDSSSYTQAINSKNNISTE